MMIRFLLGSFGFAALVVFVSSASARGDDPVVKGAGEVDATSLRGKVLCGYQGWFRCPEDAAGMGWIHWSRDRRRIVPETLTFEMWPDMSEYSAAERYNAPGFTYPDGRKAELFSSDNEATVLRHFAWMSEHGIDGVWLQHFAVDLPGGPSADRYASRMRVLQHVREAAQRTGRVWALTYDLSGMPSHRIFDVVTRDWKALVDRKIVGSDRYVRQGGLPAVDVFGFYPNEAAHRLPLDVARALVEFFSAPGPYRAYLIGSGDWNWRKNADPEWASVLKKLDGYAPWNVGNYRTDRDGVRHASTGAWAEDKAECERSGMLWIPVVYPGFSWDHLQRKAPGSTNIPRRGGQFLWEQFHELAKLGADSAFIAMFDEVDEGTAIFKVTNTPPVESHFVDYEGLPSDWYLRLVGEGTKTLRGLRPSSPELPIKRPGARQ